MKSREMKIAAAVLFLLALGGAATLLPGGAAQAPEGHGEAGVHADGEHHGEAASQAHADAAGHEDGEHHAESGEHGEEDAGLRLSDEQLRAAGVELERAAPAELSARLSLPGEIAFDADRTAHLVPRVAGVVQQVAAELGQAVKRGELLAVIASPQLSDLRSELAAAQRRLELARVTYERERQLWQEKVSAEQDYLQARQARQEAEIALANARQQLGALGAGGGDRYELRAPFDGVVVEKHLVRGEVVDENTAAFTLSDLSRVWATFAVAPRDLAWVQLGKAAQVEAVDLGMSAEGRVAQVGNLLGEQSRMASARVVVENPGGAWRPGLPVQVTLAGAPRAAAVSVAEAAIQRVEEQDVVFVRRDGAFVAQPVRLGARGQGRVEVLQGLAAGEQVAAAGSFVLKSELGKASAEHAH
ncbi:MULTISPECIES: efflux RND transporter periplasmic adaptor subunit [unclassified Pseudomonas]|uniref:efflux RND transporter periplasmic adaptor subunit n=1 Tax=unclassified Pseudomonas TaxID=196821 RepID=UPI0002A42E43|nr:MULTISPECIES: efflux RND transporter periplasmic adaptor subunit [unclassified Pseudomonas]MBB1607500.1 efflux transporter periplasmic adaptor subunit [Pseudomonas sp. UMC76]MBB1637458.1 efflux transporter periplasmic adaptor subunit [Pseudomonas sp. UME83]NTX87957.1 efflux RND transporter periplasmic adaptor subunit [Pseudomonas sp. UMA643]NTY17017.1 efflux RND transporter periplasmic adaptor subunit [Pseudomonas sp. UMC3103]NTY22880.1 efflux RND transporter periplasmic adaptor subunit [Ps